jgi:hypothetical protein
VLSTPAIVFVIKYANRVASNYALCPSDWTGGVVVSPLRRKHSSSRAENEIKTGIKTKNERQENKI